MDVYRNNLIEQIKKSGFVPTSDSGTSVFIPLKKDNTFVSSVTLTQPDTHYGDTITFAAVYPDVAARQSRQPQYPDNPYVQTFFNLPDGTGFVSVLNIQDKQKITGGWTGITYPYTLIYPLKPPSSASCNTILWYIDVNGVFHILANTTFNILYP